MKVILNNKESGFTLLESLIALLLSSMLLLLLSSGILQVNKIYDVIIADAQPVAAGQTTIKGSRQIEWHLFLNQLERNLKDTQLVEFHPKYFVVKEWDDTTKDYPEVKYYRTDTGHRNFIRSKNQGYNALLTDIIELNLQMDNQWLILNFHFQNGEVHKGRVWIESWKQEKIPEEN